MTTPSNNIVREISGEIFDSHAQSNWSPTSVATFRSKTFDNNNSLIETTSTWPWTITTLPSFNNNNNAEDEEEAIRMSAAGSETGWLLTTATSWNPIWWMIAAKIAIGILLTFCIIIAVVGNLLIVLAVSTNRRLKRLGNVFIGSLAIADLVVGVFVMPLALLNDLLGYWPLPIVMCELWCSFDVLGSTASILNLCAISLDRFICIRNSLDYAARVTVRKVIIAVVVIWTLSALISFLPFQLGLQNWTPGQSRSSNKTIQPHLNIVHNQYSPPSMSPPFLSPTEFFVASESGTSLSSDNNNNLGRFHAMCGIGCRNPLPRDTAHCVKSPHFDYDDGNDNYQQQELTSTHSALNIRPSISVTTKKAHHYYYYRTTLKPRKTFFPLTTDRFSQDATTNSPGPSLAPHDDEQVADYHQLLAKFPKAEMLLQTSPPNSLATGNSFVRKSRSKRLTDGIDVGEQYEDDDQERASSRDDGLVVHEKNALISDNTPLQQQQQCFLDISFAYALGSSTISFYIPCIVMVVIYHQLFREARKHVRAIRKYERVAYSFSNETSVSSTTTAHNAVVSDAACNNNMTSSVSEHKAAVTLGVIMGTFLLCWLPFFIINPIAAGCSGECISRVTFKALTWLGYCNSSLNPIIYSIFNQDFRLAFAKLLHLPGYSAIIAEAEKPEWLRRVPGSFRLRSPSGHCHGSASMSSSGPAMSGSTTLTTTASITRGPSLASTASTARYGGSHKRHSSNLHNNNSINNNYNSTNYCHAHTRGSNNSTGEAAPVVVLLSKQQSITEEADYFLLRNSYGIITNYNNDQNHRQNQHDRKHKKRSSWTTTSSPPYQQKMPASNSVNFNSENNNSILVTKTKNQQQTATTPKSRRADSVNPALLFPGQNLAVSGLLPLISENFEATKKRSSLKTDPAIMTSFTVPNGPSNNDDDEAPSPVLYYCKQHQIQAAGRLHDETDSVEKDFTLLLPEQNRPSDLATCLAPQFMTAKTLLSPAHVTLLDQSPSRGHVHDDEKPVAAVNSLEAMPKSSSGSFGQTQRTHKYSVTQV